MNANYNHYQRSQICRSHVDFFVSIIGAKDAVNLQDLGFTTVISYSWFNLLLPEAFFQSNIDTYPKIGSYRLPTHRRGSSKNFFPRSLHKKEILAIFLPSATNGLISKMAKSTVTPLIGGKYNILSTLQYHRRRLFVVVGPSSSPDGVTKPRGTQREKTQEYCFFRARAHWPLCLATGGRVFVADPSTLGRHVAAT